MRLLFASNEALSGNNNAPTRLPVAHFGDLGIYMCQEMSPQDREGNGLKFYTIKLPKFLGGVVKAVIGAFNKD